MVKIANIYTQSLHLISYGNMVKIKPTSNSPLWHCLLNDLQVRKRKEEDYTQNFKVLWIMMKSLILTICYRLPSLQDNSKHVAVLSLTFLKPVLKVI